MALTSPRLTALKAAILAEPSLAQSVTDRRDDLIAAHFNAASLPLVTVWRTAVTREEATAEGFDWTQVDNLTAGQARIWDWLFDNQARAINPADAGRRAGIAETWKGTAAKLAVGAFVLGKCKRTATRCEALFAVGDGTVAVPAVMGYEGTVSVNDISNLLNAG